MRLRCYPQITQINADGEVGVGLRAFARLENKIVAAEKQGVQTCDKMTCEMHPCSLLSSLMRGNKKRVGVFLNVQDRQTRQSSPEGVERKQRNRKLPESLAPLLVREGDPPDRTGTSSGSRLPTSAPPSPPQVAGNGDFKGRCSRLQRRDRVRFARTSVCRFTVNTPTIGF